MAHTITQAEDKLFVLVECLDNSTRERKWSSLKKTECGYGVNYITWSFCNDSSNSKPCQAGLSMQWKEKLQLGFLCMAKAYKTIYHYKAI